LKCSKRTILRPGLYMCMNHLPWKVGFTN